MAHIRALTLALLFVAGCNRPPPEGVYPCTTAAECPVSWVCRADSRCWMHALPVDASVTPDGGPTCGAETCNGSDDDCDGRIDENLATVGPAVVAMPAAELTGGFITPLGGELTVLGSSSGGHAQWTAIAADGTPSHASSTSTTLTGFTDALASGTYVAAGAAGTGTAAVVIDATNASPRSTLVVDHAGTPGVVHVAEFDGRYATLYVNYLGTPYAIWRARVDFQSDPAVMMGEAMMTEVQDLPFAVLHTTAADYIAYRALGGDLELGAAPIADHTGSFRMLGTLLSNDPGSDIAIAIRDATSSVSASNPIGILSSRSADVSFLRVTDTTVFAADPAMLLPGARGSSGSGAGSVLVALPSASTDASHWLAAIVNDRAQVFEIAGTASREVMVPDEMAGTERTIVSFGRAGSVLRMAEAGNAGGVVTRAIGCE
jgi:hypothetical protein